MNPRKGTRAKEEKEQKKDAHEENTTSTSTSAPKVISKVLISTNFSFLPSP